MKSFTFLLVVSLSLTACSPQVTVTSEVTVPLTPLPTSTSIPSPTITLTPTPPPLTEADLEKMTPDEKIKLAPDEIDGYTKSNISEIFGNLVLYRDENGNAQTTYNLLTKETKTPNDAGIAEFDLTDGSKLEMRFFDNAEEAFAFIAGDTFMMDIMLSRNDPSYSQKYPEQAKSKQNALEIAKNIVGTRFLNGFYPSPPENEHVVFYLSARAVEGEGMIFLSLDSEGNPKFTFLEVLDLEGTAEEFYNLLIENGFILKTY